MPCICGNLDTNKMVACANCGRWFHYECVGVSDRSVGLVWKCDDCKFNTANREGSENRNTGAGMGESSHQKQNNVIRNNVNDLGGNARNSGSIPNVDENNGVQNVTTDKGGQQVIERQQINTSRLLGSDNGNQEQQSVGSAGGSAYTLALSFKKKLMLQQIEEENQIEILYLKKRFEALEQFSASGGSVRSNVSVCIQDTITSVPKISNRVSDWVKSQNSHSEHHKIGTIRKEVNDVETEEDFPLTKNQIASRHAMSKDLPIFNGDPKDWAVFISYFENSTRKCGFSNVENMMRLEKALKGPALQAVKNKLLIPDMLPSVIKTLKSMFGRPEIIVSSLLNKIRQEPSPKAENMASLISYALLVQELSAVMKASGLVDHLNNPMLVSELVQRLPPQIKLNWGMFKRQQENSSNLTVFSDWLSDVAEAAMEVVTEPIMVPDRKTELRKDRGRHVNVNMVTRDDRVITKQCVVCDRDGHTVSECKTFVEMSRNDRWDAVIAKKLCRSCLGSGHFWRRCRNRTQCKVDGCNKTHHRMLHNSSPVANDLQISPKPSTSSDCHVHRRSTQPILFRIAPIQLTGPKGTIQTHAFLDDGSSLTMMDESLTALVGIKGETDPLCLKWTGGQTRDESQSQRVVVEISGGPNQRTYTLKDVRTVKNIGLPTQSIDIEMLKKQYSHLRGLPIKSYTEVNPMLLIGLDNYKLAIPLDIREGGKAEPVATKTRLGWTVGGVNGVKRNDVASVHHSFHICDCSVDGNDNKLDEMVRGFYEQEHYGAERVSTLPASDEHQRALKLMESTTVQVGNRYQTGLLWRYPDIKLPNSLPMAVRRLTCLEKKMDGDPLLKEKLIVIIEEYRQKGYITKLGRNEIESGDRVWYLPIFAVKNANKPNKVRVVWDAAAQVEGMSLNDALLKGPDLVKPLADVLWRFRERRVAVCGDLKEMFHQVMVIPEDRNAQRFLWREGDTTRKPDVYVMNVMTFGASCSPSSAQYVKNLNADRYINKYPRAVQAIIENHYVDDWLDCADDEEEASQLAKDVREIHLAGGFSIHQWQSNSNSVLSALGVKPNNDKKPRDVFQNDTKVLGMWWSVTDDMFRYKLNRNRIEKEFLDGSKWPTKRDALKVTMAIFDPLGLIGHFLVCTKILMQRIWRSKVGWDEKIQAKEFKDWVELMTILPEIEKVSVPRCYLGNWKSSDIEHLDLHIFVDAGENASAAVAYFRVTKGDVVRCVLAGAKTKVAPIKPTSIPRLELQAALLGARLSAAIIKAQTFKINRCFFWSDSKTVLSWLRSDHRRFKQYVAFRVAEIAETTSIKDWRWVPTHENVADDATKWPGISSMSPDSRWFKGPMFLYGNEQNWPKSNVKGELHLEEDVVEQRPIFVHSTELPKFAEVPDVKRFSKWRTLLRIQAFVLRFINIVKGKANVPKGWTLTSDEIEKAENVLLRYAQAEVYADEISSLKNGKLINNASSIFHLSPYVDADGLLRHRGRIDAVEGVRLDTKRPIILPQKHMVTQLIVHDLHCRYKHHHNEVVLNELRQRFVIPKIRALIRSICHKCQYCKNSRVIPKPPEMADLPKARLQAYLRPFSYTGLDFFGPLEVVVGRSVEKRYGAIFTCLTIRSIHLEVTKSLSSDSFIMCLRRFIARRGQPIEIRCDNGTNFIGGSNELNKEAEKIDQDNLMNSFEKIRWIFNPPASPHMGGSWERLVRSVKVGLMDSLPTRRPGDELLLTIFAEVEMVVNSRPLTYVPLETESDEAITPNHFLLGSSDGHKVPGEFTDEVLMLKKNWKISQIVVNRFWKRWLTEYLPTITKRSKWHTPCQNIGRYYLNWRHRRRNGRKTKE